MPTCSVPGCESKSRTSGLCNKHAIRLRVRGTTDSGPKAHGSVEERFLRHFARGGSKDCWPWLGHLNHNGYGDISVGGKGSGTRLAHRVSWEVANRRKIPRGKVVMHTCDVPSCVNPEHLKLGTQRDNMLDMIAKNRGALPPMIRGTDHHDARFTEADVRAIRASNEHSKMLAKKYGVNQSSITRIRSRKTWKHVK